MPPTELAHVVRERHSRSAARRRNTYTQFVATRDIVALPYNASKILDLPRGNSRTVLNENGLVGTVSISSSYSETNIRAEFASLFKKILNLEEDDLAFEFLRPVPGSPQKLQNINVAQSFKWDGRAVIGLGKKLYILLSEQYSTLVAPTQPLIVPDSNSGTPNDQRNVVNRNRRSVTLTPANEALAPANTTPLQTGKTSAESTADELFQSVLDEMDEELASTQIQVVSRVSEDNSHKSWSSIIDDHLSTVNTNSEQCIVVRRGRGLLTDAQKWFQQKGFKTNQTISVRFMGETGIDVGGPKREFMLLLAKCVAELPVFVGEDGRKTLTHEYTPMIMDNIYIAGRMIATILCHEGPPLNIFSRTLIRRIGGDSSGVDWEDIPDDQVKSFTSNFLNGTETSADMMQSLRDDVNYFKPMSDENKQEFVTAVSNYFCNIRNGAQIHRFVEGLNHDLRVGDLISAYPGISSVRFVLHNCYSQIFPFQFR